ncbi:TetR/AcrR family transcriptional regulator [Galbitalea soli]|uniref:TetR/AcrR family transcriptional regulator n=1 Tax=Galbitalea soli TaxID=1268042 RepID=A0A7C9TSB2_9MICO|nr:TetR/AcrR family transcriptional regulator [Galbitalea soli]NEM91960.1 TetR/AcrR family transcriptional regulator [Galbitalea soli]NYJ32092.1 AcrR family transcriptional regulator [Galbitalea soli]
MARRTTGSYAAGRARRERILDAATENFARQGYHRTSMARIAQDVGLTGPGLAHHFASKSHLLLAIAERRLDMTGHWAEEALAPDDGTGPLRGLLELTRRLAEQPGLIELFVLVSAESADPASPAHELYARRYATVVEQLGAAFERDVAAGLLRRDLDCAGLARECVAVSDGLQLQWVIAGGALDLVGCMRAYLERLAPGILASGAAVQLD